MSKFKTVKAFGIISLLLLALSASLNAQQSHNKSGSWLEVTKPMVACSNAMDSLELRKAAMKAVSAWQNGGSVPEGCFILRRGAKYLYDREEPASGRPELVKMIDICRGCAPGSSPVYAPSHELVGSYLRPSKPPPGWD